MADLLFSMPIQYEPKKKNRFVLRFLDEHINIPEYHVQTVDRPFYDAKTKSWGDMEVRLIDVIGPSTSKAVYDQIVLLNKDLDRTIFTMQLDSLDPVGVCIESWKFIGELVHVDFGGFDYSLDDVADVRIKFKMKRCFIKDTRHLMLEKIGVRFVAG